MPNLATGRLMVGWSPAGRCGAGGIGLMWCPHSGQGMVTGIGIAPIGVWWGGC